MTDDDDILAAEYVLGLTEPAAVAAVEARLAGDADFQAGVARWEARLLPYGTGIQPSPALWGRIERQLDAAAAAPASRTVHGDDGTWEDLAPGVERKVVHVDAAAGRISYYVRMRAGAVLPRHRHPANEHCAVLEGELAIGDLAFGPGAFHFVPAGVAHPRIVANVDSLFFIHGGA